MAETRATNLTPHASQVTREDRRVLLGQKGATLWFTGLSGSGKSTTACAVERLLVSSGRLAYVLDGDNIRHGLNRNLGFGPADREENIRRIGEVAKLFADAGLITLTAFISPYRKDRDLVRSLHREAGLPFIEVHMATPLRTCEQRDPKGLYRKARSGELKGFTGIDDPYEPPSAAELTLDAGELDPSQAADRVVSHLRSHGLID